MIVFKSLMDMDTWDRLLWNHNNHHNMGHTMVVVMDYRYILYYTNDATLLVVNDILLPPCSLAQIHP